ncbi:hypothetical protein GOP47_0024259, partial [Adiantum capillus-veneris]
ERERQWMEMEINGLVERMSDNLVACAVAVVVGVGVVALFALSRAEHVKRMPPLVSRGWPLIGHTLHFIATHSVFELHPFIKHGIRRYGKVFQASLFGKRTIVSADTELTKLIIQGEGKTFRSAWPDSLIRILGQESLIVTSGEEHRHSRALLVAYMGSNRSKLSSFLPHIEAATLEIMSNWKSGSIISFKDEAKHFTFSVLCKIMISLGKKEVAQTHTLFETYDDSILSIPLNFPGTRYNKGLKARSKLVAIIQEIINKRRNQTKCDHENKDLLDYLLSNAQEYSDTKLQDFILTALFAGHSTSAIVLACIVKLLHDTPKALQEIMEEHEKIQKTKTQGEDLDMNDYMKMSFTQNVINETLRLVNLSLGLFKVALEDVELKGHFIPKGCIVFVSQIAVHFDSDVYPNPERFDPSRWKN